MPFENNWFMYHFFAPQGRYEACGMFTTPHLIAAFTAIALVFVLLMLYKKGLFAPEIGKLTRSLAIIVTILELIKISHSFLYGDLYLDAWFPLSYCGLFIFALWMASFGTNIIGKIGRIFIAYGCPFAGLAFLIFPTTSLMNFPVWHYFSIYSLLFHFLMIYLGVIYLFNEESFGPKTFCCYSLFVIFFAIPAISLNCAFDSNLMNLHEPYNIPIQLIQNLYSFSSVLYTIVVIFLYMLIPIIVAAVFKKFKKS